MNKEQIKEFLPHREPMLLVDSLEVDADGIGHGEYTIKDDDFFCYGPTKESRIVCGSVLCEIMAQSCVAVVLDSISQYLPLYTSINNVKFNGVVRPGDKCIITTRLQASKGAIFICETTLEVDGELKCSGELACALTPR